MATGSTIKFKFKKSATTSDHEVPSNSSESKATYGQPPPGFKSRGSSLGPEATQPEADLETDIDGEAEHCHLCDQTNADAFCLECKQYLCSACQRIHQRGTTTKDHTVKKLEDLFSIPEEKPTINETDARDDRDKKKNHKPRRTRAKDKGTRVGEATYIEQIDLTSTDKRKVIIAAMEVTEAGELLICDSSNNKIKLYDSNYKILSEVELTSKPMGMVSVTASDFIVSLPKEQCLQKVKIKNAVLLSLEDKIKTKLKIYRLLRYNDQILAYAHDDLYRFFNIMDTEGNTIRCIMNEPRASDNTPVVSNLTYMCLGLDNKSFYVTDHLSGCIGISINGKEEFRFKDTDTGYHHGVCPGPDNAIYVACNDSDKIVAIDKKGQKICDLISVKGMKPAYIFYSQTVGKLFVKRGGSNKVLIYDISS